MFQRMMDASIVARHRREGKHARMDERMVPAVETRET